jgi:hypothetical protein
MIVLFTDYGLAGPYLGEVEAVLFRYAPAERVIRLMADVPPQNVQAGAYLLAALSRGFPKGSIFFCVVDPGVGSGRDPPIMIRMNEHRFVGPHNGLFDIVTRSTGIVDCWEITYQPVKLSNSFHGRDLYAPVCAMLAKQQPVPGKKVAWSQRHSWPDDLAEIIYFDGFGNAWTGLRASSMDPDTTLTVAGKAVKHALTFADANAGEPFWYENSSGLVEIAVNRGSAEKTLELKVGTGISW